MEPNKISNIHAIWLQAREKEKGEDQEIFEEMVFEKFPDLAKEKNLQLQTAQLQTKYTIRNPYQDLLSSNFWKLKAKKKNTKSIEREMTLYIDVETTRMTDFSRKIMEARRKQHNIFQTLKKKPDNTEFFTQQNYPSETKH